LAENPQRVDGETPQAAIDAIAARWPTLRFWLVPHPAE
jgi:hypothetical protein